MSEKYEMPKHAKSDLPARVVRGAANIAPGELIVAEFLSSPLQERGRQWDETIAYGLEKLEEKATGFKTEQLKKNESFITALSQARIIAIRNHDPVKHKALRDAVLNVACGRAPGDDQQLIFLNWVDALTGLHLRMLRILSNIDLGTLANGSVNMDIVKGMPELVSLRGLYGQLWQDLLNRGLLTKETAHITKKASSLMGKRTTDLGDQFLSFITSPIED